MSQILSFVSFCKYLYWGTSSTLPQLLSSTLHPRFPPPPQRPHPSINSAPFSQSLSPSTKAPLFLGNCSPWQLLSVKTTPPLPVPPPPNPYPNPAFTSSGPSVSEIALLPWSGSFFIKPPRLWRQSLKNIYKNIYILGQIWPVEQLTNNLVIDRGPKWLDDSVFHSVLRSCKCVS